MAHDLEIVNGKASMFSVKEVPWHGLGTIVHDAPNAAEAIRLAGLDWTVSRRSIISTEAKVGLLPIPEYRAIVRDDNEAVLAVLGKGYTPLQNKEAFDFFNPFVESGLASFETAGSLSGGRRVWVLAKLNKAPIEIGNGDEVNKFLLLSNGHDGMMAVRTGFTPVRVVCANTLAMAHGKGSSELIRVRHSAKVQVRVEQLQEIVNAADAKFEATAEQYRLLSKSDVSSEDIKKYVRVVFDLEDERKELARERMTNDIIRLFETGRGSDLKSAKGTMWGLYNAVSEKLVWEAGKSTDARLNSLWFSQGARLNAKALEEAVRMSA